MEKYRTTRFKAKDSKYSRSHADYVVSFIEYLSYAKGTWVGKPFNILPWQE